MGAVVVANGQTLGEGYHHRAGEEHAEVHALRAAGDRAHGATLYVSLEPCDRTGRTPPCTNAVVAAGIARVVIGAADPHPATDGRGAARLREAGIEVEIADDPRARALIERFAVAVRGERPFVTLKLAASLDGYMASAAGQQEWLTGEAARAFVRELRIEHDAVMVGAGTVRVDDPQLTVRPAHHRLHDYLRVVACESGGIDLASRVLEERSGYARTVVLAPGGTRDGFDALGGVAETIFVGGASARQLDLEAALRALHARGVQSLLCEGGPTLASRLIARGLVDRFHWLIAPRLLRGEGAVPALGGADLSAIRPGLRFERVELLGPDILLTGSLQSDV